MANLKAGKEGLEAEGKKLEGELTSYLKSNEGLFGQLLRSQYGIELRIGGGGPEVLENT